MARIRLQPPLWFLAFASQGSIAALGPGLRIPNYNPCYRSRPMRIWVLSQLSGPGPCISDYMCNPCYGSWLTRIGALSQLQVPACAYQTTTPTMGPGPYVSVFYHSFGFRPAHIRLQPLQWVQAHANQNTNSALDPGPCVSRSDCCYRSCPTSKASKVPLNPNRMSIRCRSRNHT